MNYLFLFCLIKLLHQLNFFIFLRFLCCVIFHSKRNIPSMRSQVNLLLRLNFCVRIFFGFFNCVVGNIFRCKLHTQHSSSPFMLSFFTTLWVMAFKVLWLWDIPSINGSLVMNWGVIFYLWAYRWSLYFTEIFVVTYWFFRFSFLSFVINQN